MLPDADTSFDGENTIDRLFAPLVDQARPLASGEIIDGFPARDGLISQGYEGVLSNSAKLKPLPFEIIFETPQNFPADRQGATDDAR